MAKQIAVIGLGRFGESLCLELMAYGAEVFAIDCDEKSVDNISEQVTEALIADTTHEATIDELNVKQFDSIFVAIGDDTKASILTTLILKEAGAKNVWVKSKDKFHEKILKKIGADHVINPEFDMGKRISRSLLSNLFFDYLDLGDSIAICEFEISELHKDKNIVPQRFEQDHQISLLAIKRKHQVIKLSEQPIDIEAHDIAVIAGEHHHIKAFLNKI